MGDLDTLQKVQQRKRLESGCDLRHGVDVIWLIGGTHGWIRIQRRAAHTDHLGRLGKLHERSSNLSFRGIQVATKPHIGNGA